MRIIATSFTCMLLSVLCLWQALKDGMPRTDRIIFIVASMIFMLANILIGVVK